MQQPHQNSRVNLAQLKALIVKKLGPDLSKQYFHFLDKFLSMKMSQIEFTKLCSRIFGRENIPLHNHFIRSVLKNACTGKHPPTSQVHNVVKSNNAVESKETSTHGFLQNGSYNNAAAQVPNHEGLSNGDILSLSPRKARTVHRDRRSGDRRSAFGANGKTNFVSRHLTGKESNLILDNNGITIHHDVPGSMHHHHHEVSRLPIEREREASAQTPLKDEVLTEREGEASAQTPLKDGPDVRDRKDLHARSQLQAPLGLPFCSASEGGAHGVNAIASSSKCIRPSSSSVLFDSETMKDCMEQIAASQGLEGVSMDCANLLSHGLDAYLKGLISSCTSLVAARSSYEQVNNRKQHILTKPVNGIRTGHLQQIQSGSKSLDMMQEHRTRSSISLQDFRVAMELNPQQLGADWPLLLERICAREHEE